MFRRVGDLLNEDRSLSPVTRWHERLQRLNAALAPHLPAELRRQVRVASHEGQRISLMVRSNAVAARLRQLTPRLVAALRAAGIPVTELQLRVDPQQTGQRPQKERLLTPHAQEALAALQEQLPDGPVKAAVARLRHTGRKG